MAGVFHLQQLLLMKRGHAVQHAKAYAWLGFRSKLVPVVSFSSKWVQWILLGRNSAG